MADDQAFQNAVLQELKKINTTLNQILLFLVLGVIAITVTVIMVNG